MKTPNALERRGDAPVATFPRNALGGMPLALYPRAFGFFFFEPFQDPGVEVRDDGVAVVRITGPLEHHACWYSDSYDAICERFDAALEAKPKAILLVIDSPGGLVAGCFELATHMRDACAAASVPLYAYAEGMCCSAAYLLACSAQKIGASKSSMVGSIGVIDCLVDATAIDEMWGVKYRLITSGERKADGNPHKAIDDGAILATQQRVDDLAAMFFEWVGEARPALGAEGAKALEANVYVGTRAFTAGLLDALSDPSVLLDEATSSTESANMKPKAEDEKPTDDEKKKDEESKASDGDMYRKLRKMADEGDEDAKKMLKKLEGDGDEAKSETDEDEKKAEGDDADAKAKAFEKRIAKLVDERVERANLIASRTDFDQETRDLLALAPIEKVRAYVARPKGTPPNRAAAAQPDVRPAAMPSDAKDRPALGFTPPVTDNDRARHALAQRLVGGTNLIVGAKLERDASGRVAKVEFGIDREPAKDERNPDRLAAVRLRGRTPMLGGLGGTTRVA